MIGGTIERNLKFTVCRSHIESREVRFKFSMSMDLVECDLNLETRDLASCHNVFFRSCDIVIYGDLNRVWRSIRARFFNAFTYGVGLLCEEDDSSHVSFMMV